MISSFRNRRASQHAIDGARSRRIVVRAAATVAALAATGAGVLGAAPAGATTEVNAVYGFGGARDHGEPGHHTAGEVVALAPTHSGDGYWSVTDAGGVFTYGDAPFHGSLGGRRLVKPIVGADGHPRTSGYWLVASDGGVFSFGGARFHGSLGGRPLNRPIVSMAATPSGRGYWLVASDGGVFTFGDATFRGSLGGRPLNQPVVDIAATPSGRGYWLVGRDGGVFSFGDARYHGNAAATARHAVVGLEATPSGGGYWITGEKGGVFSFGDAGFHGSLGNTNGSAPVVDATSRRAGDGYWVVTGRPAPPPPPPPAPAPAVFAVNTQGNRWDLLARCESGGRWNINSGNGYYGGVQFSLGSWRAVGGTGYPHHHSRETQIAMAERLLARQGWGAWPHCSRKLGFR